MKVWWHLVPNGGNELLGEVAILSSLASPDSGFQSLRTATIKAAKQRQEFRFQGVGARWLMIRITPNPDSVIEALSEIEVLGARGAPRSVYAFKETPSDALEVIDRLVTAVEVGIGSDERALFDDAADGGLNDWSLAEAALLASGVVDKEARTAYMERISELQADIDAQLAAIDGSFARGQALLDSGSWEEAIAVYELGLHRMPGTSSFEQNIRYCRQQMSLAK